MRFFFHVFPRCYRNFEPTHHISNIEKIETLNTKTQPAVSQTLTMTMHWEFPMFWDTCLNGCLFLPTKLNHLSQINQRFESSFFPWWNIAIFCGICSRAFWIESVTQFFGFSIFHKAWDGGGFHFWLISKAWNISIMKIYLVYPNFGKGIWLCSFINWRRFEEETKKHTPFS